MKTILMCLLALLLAIPAQASILPTKTIAVDSTVLIAVVPRVAADSYKAHVYASGTWGGGTLKLQWSPDAGTTKFDATDNWNNVATLTANGHIGPIEFPKPNVKSNLYIYAVLSGATNPNLVVGLFDNN